MARLLPKPTRATGCELLRVAHALMTYIPFAVLGTGALAVMGLVVRGMEERRWWDCTDRPDSSRGAGS